MPLLTQYLAIGLGGALGSMLRFALASLIDANVAKAGQVFPWGTVVVNITGCFVIGFIYGIAMPDGRVVLGSLARSFILIGILGGYTTFSSFGLQTFILARAGLWSSAAANVLVSVILCLAGVWLGAFLAEAVNRMR